jgi:hypothetical protein
MLSDISGCSPEWWNPFSWTKDTWEKIGLTALVVIVVVGLTIATAGLGGAVAAGLGGGFWAAVAGGAVGGAISGAIFGSGYSIASQGITTGYNNFDWEKVGIDTLIGTGSGALMGAAFAAAGRGFGLLGKTKWAQRLLKNWSNNSKNMLFGSKSGNFTFLRNGHQFRIESSIQHGLHFHGATSAVQWKTIFLIQNQIAGIIGGILPECFDN